MTIKEQAELPEALRHAPVPRLWEIEQFVEDRMMSRILSVDPDCLLAKELQQRIIALSQDGNGCCATATFTRRTCCGTELG